MCILWVLFLGGHPHLVLTAALGMEQCARAEALSNVRAHLARSMGWLNAIGVYRGASAVKKMKVIVSLLVGTVLQ